MFKHILIPTDGSPVSQKAALRGVELAKATGARVTALFAAPPATPVLYRDNLPAGYATPIENARVIERTAEKYLGHVERAAKAKRVAFEAVTVTSDFPADTILKIAEKKKCDLIVMGSQGQSGLKGLLIGSQAQKVIAKSKIPVLVLR